MLPAALLPGLVPGIVFMLSVMGGVCRVVAAIGGAMLFTMCWSLAGDMRLTSGLVKDAAAFLIFWDLASIAVVWAQREKINPALALAVGLPWTIFEMAGTALLIQQGKSPWFKRSFGVLLLGVLALDLCGPGSQRKAAPPAAACAVEAAVVGSPSHAELDQEGEAYGQLAGRTPTKGVVGRLAAGSQERYDLRDRTQLFWAMFLGVAGGLLKGVYTVPMPAISAFILFSGIEKDEWRCNGVFISWLTTPPKAWYFFFVQSEFEVSYSLGYAAAAMGAIVAVPLGTYIASFVDKEKFKSWVRVLTFTGATSMCAFATGFQLPAAFLALLLASSGALLAHRRRPGMRNMQRLPRMDDFST